MDGQTDTGRQTDIHISRQTVRKTQADRWTDSQADIFIDRQIDGQACRQMDRQSGIHIYRQTDR